MQAPVGLDLRPPTEVIAGSPAARLPASDSAAAGSPASISAAGDSAAAAYTSQSGHIVSRMQLMAHNFRQQGLPLAKLFENKDSLVHLGLNQKGKPGLWFVHELH
jgi:hypothetical protein